jgi:membrane associated rhomboid family serine protease
MFPLRDSIPSSRPPVVTVLLIAACTLVFIFELSLGRGLERFLLAYAFMPARLFHPAAFGVSLFFNVKSTLLSIFLHGGWLHLIGNMWFLWIFGDNVEDTLGHGRYLVFYLVSGGVAALAQAAVAPASQVPMIGASGAIAGVLGAYLVWFPRAQVKTLVFLGILFWIMDLPALLFLALWFVVQFFSGTLAIASASAGGGGVAFFAHIGGFITGIIVALTLRFAGIVRPYRPNRVVVE